jgi:hypothetical protein
VLVTDVPEEETLAEDRADTADPLADVDVGVEVPEADAVEQALTVDSPAGRGPLQVRDDVPEADAYEQSLDAGVEEPDY